MKKLSIPMPGNPVSALASGAGNLVNSWKEYSVTRETEATKRSQIAANREIALASIKAQAEGLRQLIEGTFAERAMIFDRSFNMLEAGFRSGNEKQIESALELIVKQVQESPMKQAVKIMSKINDANDSDVIEI